RERHRVQYRWYPRRAQKDPFSCRLAALCTSLGWGRAGLAGGSPQPIGKENTMNMNRSTIALGFVLAVACLVSAGSAAVSDSKDQSNAALAFDKLKSLVGQWEATTDKGKITTTYELVGGGSALLERVNIAGQ